MRKAVFLVIHFVPHQETTIKTLIANYGLSIQAYTFHAPHKPQTNMDNLEYFNANNYESSQILKQILEFKPDFMVVAGWVRNQYVNVAKKIRKQLSIPVIAFSDTQWNRTYRQCINTWLSSFHLKKSYSHIWISGIYQYEYAKKLGFKNHEILHNFLSCDIQQFNNISIRDKTKDSLKKIVFIGRLVKNKGLDLLIEAWKTLAIEGYELRIIGAGKSNKNHYPDSVTFCGFLNQKEINKELKEAYAFVLPSRFEPWGIVIHEAAAAGIPLLVSRQCGAVPYFLMHGYNGYILSPTVKSIQKYIKNIAELSSEEYIRMSKRSRTLSKRITPDIVTANLMSIFESNES